MKDRNNLSYKEFHRRNLPHVQPKDGILFVTYCLYNTLPLSIRNKIRNNRKNLADNFLIYDDYLDLCKESPKWLSTKEVAQIVYDNLLKMNHIQYELFCFCIMLNHVHVLLKPNLDADDNPFSIAKIMHGHKGVTAKKINKSFNQQGHFWHSEYYDHYIRNDTEFYNIAWYIINNPVKANLISEIKKWKFIWIEKQLDYELELDLL